MSNAFVDCSKIGHFGEDMVAEYFRLVYPKLDVRFILYNERDSRSVRYQMEYGDFYSQNPDKSNRQHNEIKTEKSSYTGNLFIEIWSNKNRGVPGWFYNPKYTNVLYYVFLEEQVIYKVDFQKLKSCEALDIFEKYEGTDGDVDMYKYKLKEQGKWEQENDSWGHCVPITDLLAAGVITEVIHMEDVRKGYPAE